jgi:hypothetical protein
LASSGDPTDLCLSSSQDYKLEPLSRALFLIQGFPV